MEEIEIGRGRLPIGDVQFLQNSVDVIFDGADLDRELFRDLLVAESLADENQDFALARSEFDRCVGLELNPSALLCQLGYT